MYGAISRVYSAVSHPAGRSRGGATATRIDSCAERASVAASLMAYAVSLASLVAVISTMMERIAGADADQGQQRLQRSAPRLDGVDRRRSANGQPHGDPARGQGGNARFDRA